MSPVEMGTADWLVLGGYLLLVTGIGVIASRKVKSTEHYFLGERKFGRAVMIAQSFGTGTHAEMPVSLAGAVYTMGLSAIWFQWKSLFVTPFYWLLAPLYRRFRRTTMSEVVEDRYGPWMGAFYTVFALIFFTINLGSMLKGAAKVIDQAVGGGLPVNGIVIGMTLVFVFYSFIGGIVATAWSEVVQGLLIITLSFVVIPLGWHLVGGFGGLRETLGAAKLSLVAPQGIGFWFIVVLTINGLVGIIAQPHLIAAVGTGKDEVTCRVGQLYGNMIKRVCTSGWAIVGLMAAVLVMKGTFGATTLRDPEEAFGFACRHLLFPGGVGLLVACFLAANMAGCSAFMVDSGAMVTNGLYRKFVAPGKSDRHYLWTGRISGVAVTLLAAGYAVVLIDKVLYSFLMTETLAAFMGVSILGSIVWRRANRWGAAASVVVAMTCNFAGYAIRDQRLDNWDPKVFIVALLVGIVVFVVVSLLTPAEAADMLQRFYGNLQTPSNPGQRGESAEHAARTGEQLVLVNLLHLKRASHGHGLRAFRADLRGFAIGCALVALLIASAWLVFRTS